MIESPQGGIHEATADEEIGKVFMERPHVLVLGAGASKAALPNGDRTGRPVPLLREVAENLDLFSHFPEDLHELARSDFEAAYSKLVATPDSTNAIQVIDERVVEYFDGLELPDDPNLYDVLNLTLRDKDAIFTFNWDPFLVQSRLRLSELGVQSMPQPFFLHGTVRIGYCVDDANSGLIGRRCSMCGAPFEPTRLLFPVDVKNYQDGHFIEREWKAMRRALGECFMLTVFGYSAPRTDVEAIDLMKEAWGQIEDRDLEQTEIVARPGADHDALRETWDPFIHSHHYDIVESFYESWIAHHPRRSGEAYWNQFIEAKFIDNHTVPQGFDDVKSLVTWFQPLFDAE